METASEYFKNYVNDKDEEISAKSYNFSKKTYKKMNELENNIRKHMSESEIDKLDTTEKKPPEGFACPIPPKRKKKSLSRLVLLEYFFMQGEKKKSDKVSPIDVFNFMRNTYKEDGNPIFDRKELLSVESIKSWFSTRKRKKPNAIIQHEAKMKELEALPPEQRSASKRIYIEKQNLSNVAKITSNLKFN